MNPKFRGYNMMDHIHESNLIENIDSNSEDYESFIAWRFLTEQPSMNLDVLLDLHGLITHNQLPKSQSGKFRTVNVQVGGQICPEPYMAQQLIHNWLYAMQYQLRFCDPLEMHIKFEKIHPFIDGNGPK